MEMQMFEMTEELFQESALTLDSYWWKESNDSIRAAECYLVVSTIMGEIIH